MPAEPKGGEAECSESPDPSRSPKSPCMVTPGNPLSARECEVVVIFCEGVGLREVAYRLGISHHTAGEHLKRVYRKLGFTSQIQLVRYAIRTGMIAA
jgi:DNA-binding CsgD family transcriptional regulator